jgi:uncharacterized protein YndB with AHSA1/START domain
MKRADPDRPNRGLVNCALTGAASLSKPLYARDKLARVHARGEPTMKITVETRVRAPIEKAWRAYTTPAHVTKWNFASDDWHCPRATGDLRAGGKFSSRMEAKDGSMGFDFEGIYTNVVEQKLIEYSFGNRAAKIEFVPDGKDVAVRVTFDSEPMHTEEQQRDGWQAILNNFARHAETL